jgi:hypothetical protein
MNKLLALALLAAACGGSSSQLPPPAPPDTTHRSLTAEECTKAIDHALEIIDPEAAESLRAERDKMQAECLSTAHEHDYNCLMAAQDAKALDECPEPEATHAAPQ